MGAITRTLLGKIVRGIMASRFGPWILGGAALAYLIMPMDFLPDVIPGLGIIDDTIVVPILLYMAVKRFRENKARQSGHKGADRNTKPKAMEPEEVEYEVL